MYLYRQMSGIHWWYQTASHAAELTCGYYNTSYRDGYSSIAKMFAKHNATFNFTCAELLTSELSKHCPQAMADPEGLVSQVHNVNFLSTFLFCGSHLWLDSRSCCVLILVV
jgi:beta-amylase